MQSEIESGSDGGVVSPPEAGVTRFLRYSHVLGSVLREILEDSFLRDRCGARLNRMQLCSLKLVTLASGLRMGDLARCLGVSPAATSKNVDVLARQGLLLRREAPDDRRATVLWATAEGRRLVEQYERLKASRVVPVFESLSEDESEVLCDLLERVCAGLVEGCVPRGTCLRCTGYFHSSCAVAARQEGCVLRRHREQLTTEPRWRS